MPDAQCIELKSLKYYIIGFRNRGIFYEHVTNEILDDLVAAIHPRRMTVVGDFSVRGGIKTVVTALVSENAKIPIEPGVDLHAFAPRDIRASSDHVRRRPACARRAPDSRARAYRANGARAPSAGRATL